MDHKLLSPMALTEPQIAAETRARLRESGVFTVNVIGGMGSGKTSLIRSTLESMRGKLRLGVVTADPSAVRDIADLRRCARDVLQVDPGTDSALTAAKFAAGLRHLDLARLDALLIENVDPLCGQAGNDLGQDAVAAVVSVAAGDAKAFKCPNVIAVADVVVLNKIDLLGVVPFDLGRFREQVRRINLTAKVLEVSTLNGIGTTAWEDWLVTSAARRNEAAVT